MKDELNGQMTRLRADCADRVCQLEKQLDLSNEHRTSSMFQMKEEVIIYCCVTTLYITQELIFYKYTSNCIIIL